MEEETKEIIILIIVLLISSLIFYGFITNGFTEPLPCVGVCCGMNVTSCN